MSANESKIIRLDEARAKLAQPVNEIDPDAILQRITRARAAPTAEERDLAMTLVVEDAARLVRLLTDIAPELLRLKIRVQMFAQQSADLGTIIAVLLNRSGGEVRMPLDWFRAFKPSGTFEVTEEGDEVVIRSISASQQTED